MTAPTQIVDGKAECPRCGNWYTVTAAGSIRAHKCVGEDGVVEIPPAKSAKSTTTSKMAGKKAPSKVRSLGSALIAGGIEWGSTQYMAKSIPCDASQIPDEIKDIPDADAMVGPFIELIWPTLPKGAQKLISEIAEHDDVIAALFMWATYFGHIKSFTEGAHKQVMDSRKLVNINVPTQAPEQGNVNGIPVRVDEPPVFIPATA